MAKDWSITWVSILKGTIDSSAKLSANINQSVNYVAARFPATVNCERYHKVIKDKSIWEEQGFHYDDRAYNYGLERFLHNKLQQLGWFKFGRHSAQANIH
ncbi:hypothetical protein GQ457_18G000330 [Hibiscus cannabinus]